MGQQPGTPFNSPQPVDVRRTEEYRVFDALFAKYFGDGASVVIVDQNGTPIQSVQAPGRYQITLFSGVKDDVINGNSTTIIDDII